MTNTKTRKAALNKTFDDKAVTGAEKRFVASLGSGVAMTVHAFTLFTDAVETGDTGKIAGLVETCKAKQDSNAARSLVKIMQMVWPDCTFRQAKVVDGKTIPAAFITKGIKADSEVMDRFALAVKDKLSMRGTTLATKLAGPAPEMTEEEKQQANVKRACGSMAKIAVFAVKNNIPYSALKAAYDTAAKEAKEEMAAKAREAKAKTASK